MSEVMWFKPSERGRRVNTGKGDYSMIFIEKPRGVRFNAVVSKMLEGFEVKNVQIGLTDDVIFVKPSGNGDGFSLIGNKSAYHVSAASVYHWAEEHGMVGKRLKGEWDNDNLTYRFPMANAEDGNN